LQAQRTLDATKPSPHECSVLRIAIRPSVRATILKLRPVTTNSVTGFTLHEHNHFTVVTNFVAGTVTLNGAINIMQRRGMGEVIQRTGHKVIDLATDEPLELHGPEMANDPDFCAAVAP
jgi:hypothetical protein